MGEVIRTDRFPKPKTPKQRERLRRKFARCATPVASRMEPLAENDLWRRR